MIVILEKGGCIFRPLEAKFCLDKIRYSLEMGFECPFSEYGLLALRIAPEL